MIGKLIATMFLSREVAHREHLKTKSYAAHMALGDFYDAIIDNADAVAEAYQGKYEIIEDIPMLTYKGSASIDDILEDQMSQIEKMRYDAVPSSDSTIQNLIDEAIATYLTALYKLRRFK